VRPSDSCLIRAFGRWRPCALTSPRSVIHALVLRSRLLEQLRIVSTFCSATRVRQSRTPRACSPNLAGWSSEHRVNPRRMRDRTRPGLQPTRFPSPRVNVPACLPGTAATRQRHLGCIGGRGRTVAAETRIVTAPSACKSPECCPPSVVHRAIERGGRSLTHLACRLGAADPEPLRRASGEHCDQSCLERRWDDCAMGGVQHLVRHLETRVRPAGEGV
jgi:hypothetical protein